MPVTSLLTYMFVLYTKYDDMNNVPFTALMSVYFAENPVYLEECFKSILDQTVSPSQMVIVLDGPVGHHLQNPINKFASSAKFKVDVLELSTNCGLGIALNHGLNWCNNNIVVRVDSDDINVENRFERLLDAISMSSIDIVGSYVQEFNLSVDDMKLIRKVPLSRKDILEYSKLRNPFNHMSIAFKKDKVIANGGYMDMPGFEDFYLWKRMLTQCDALNIPEILVYARRGNGLINRRHGIKYLKMELNFHRKLYFEGYISFTRLIWNVLIRGLPRLLPVLFLVGIYNYFMRSNGSKL